MTIRIQKFEENLQIKKKEEALKNIFDPYKGLKFPYLTENNEHYTNFMKKIFTNLEIRQYFRG
jgi:hypothetical protein